MTAASPPPLPQVMIPYASPATHLAQEAPPLWREDGVLVARDGTLFLPHCVKCNAPVNPARFIRKTYYWHHPALYLIILAGILIYAIVALIVRNKGTVRFYLCDQHRQRRMMCILLAWILAPGGLVLLIAGAVNESGAIALLGGLAFVAGLVAALLTPGLRPSRIDRHFLWLKGASPAFLAELPGIVRQ